MSQRTIAGLLALPTIVALLICAFVLPLPYTIYSPGETVDLLGMNSGKPIVTVGKGGPEIYRDGGKLRMVTVSVTVRSHHPKLFEMLAAWANSDDAVYPLSYAYPDEGTSQSDHKAGSQQMTSAQDIAEQVAIAAVSGARVFRGVIVGSITPKTPAAAALKVGDVITAIGGRPVTTPASLKAVIVSLPAGKAIEFHVTRAGKAITVQVTPEKISGRTRIGVGGPNGGELMSAVSLPYDVQVNIPSDITGPSAGLMMTLSIYDELTPGSLTGNGDVAGTGTIDQSGNVGEIGGIQQKIPGAKNDGAQLFLVPAGNCPDVANADHGSMRLAKVSTFADALKVVQTWAKDHNAPLPSC
ncbi:hypothetical protein Back2_07390 [Nocardioides baekrokdamisoli]|uniref:endopeptidase La n=1 Tax=Nocardioides baekrokdamisoli TaxID=1804624 RepID=A0A3G9IDK5_9ACTN|nr:PDZ domain-containing protein [Nocardioides baekrokdamisoli]BBH16452.1 hypothetical protein Back2_07390 [Nocardioides baekrokdamisoli]